MIRKIQNYKMNELSEDKFVTILDRNIGINIVIVQCSPFRNSILITLDELIGLKVSNDSQN